MVAVLSDGTRLTAPDGIITVQSFEGGMYDLNKEGQELFIDKHAVDQLIADRVWEVNK